MSTPNPTEVMGGAEKALSEAGRDFVLAEGDGRARLQALKTAAANVGPWVQYRFIHKTDAFDYLFDLADTRGLIDELGEQCVSSAIMASLDEPSPLPALKPDAEYLPDIEERPPFDRGEDEPPPIGEPAQAIRTVPSLSAFSAADLRDEAVPQRRWLVRERIPMAAHTLLSGDGAAGKTTILLQLCHAVVRGTDWLGAVVEEQGPAIFMTGEEDRAEIHRRLAAINARMGTTFYDLTDLHIVSLPGEDVVLGTTSPDGLVRPTALYQQFEAVILRVRPKLIAVEAAADVFAGNENSRPEVRQFSQILRRLAIKADAALVLVQHPSVSGLAEGNGRSGSTGWRNSFRSQLHFAGLRKAQDESEADASDLRTLTVGKSNYGPAGEVVTVRYDRGVFVPDGAAPSLDRIAAEAETDALFLRLFDQTAAQGRDVSPSKSSTYAPTVFERMPAAGGVRSRAFAAAMERLLAAGTLVVDTFGPPSKQRQRLARKAGK